MIENEKYNPQLLFAPNIILTNYSTTQKACNTSYLSWEPTSLPSFVSKVGN